MGCTLATVVASVAERGDASVGGHVSPSHRQMTHVHNVYKVQNIFEADVYILNACGYDFV